MAAHLTLLDRPAGAPSPLTSESEVHFLCVGRDRWSIYDRRLDPADPAAFLGRLQRIAGLFEVTFADPARPRVWCVSLAASRAEFVDRRVPGRPRLRLV
ncbi:hypothetical protein AS850_11445 [Frondihabitans sp. 762G35]|uniref:hypothetical protein n=1 Tax=Frondihabitans sp. 762G35 TaxID=1446794 RepID=UPI000D2008FD|nr:hypothetical protein [Frondihabitans sp. 762G35]ARC57686.1 hypothetical protein AS850_11445 [Frondihabitans sp. 762G35]